MRKRFKYPLTIIGLLIATLFFIGVCYFFYDKYIDDAIVLADGNLSINFINGNTFDNWHNKTLKFTIINNSEDSSYFYIQFTEISGNAEYTLSSNTDLTIKDSLRSGIVSSYIEIKGGETQNYNITFSGSGKYRGVITIAKEATNYDTFADILFEAYPPKEEMATSYGDISTTNEGLIAAKDDSGITYFFRGKIDNNYVSFADQLWRVVRINSDGSVRLVLDGIINSVTDYYDESNGYQFNESKINKMLQDYYKNQLFDYADYISTINYCNDITTKDNNFTAYNRVFVDHIITFNCLSEKYLSMIGLLTIDEAVAAGASYDKENTDYYLYNNSIDSDYYLMSSYKMEADKYFPFIIRTSGSVFSSNGMNKLGVRPVISIIKNITVIGDGTKTNPYIIKSIDSI